MNRDQFLEHDKKLSEQAHALMERKNDDYANSEYAFANFKHSEIAGVPMELGVIVRMSDKMSRIANLIKKGGEGSVKEESMRDNIMDLKNYAGILDGILVDKEMLEELK